MKYLNEFNLRKYNLLDELKVNDLLAKKDEFIENISNIESEVDTLKGVMDSNLRKITDLEKGLDTLQKLQPLLPQHAKDKQLLAAIVKRLDVHSDSALCFQTKNQRESTIQIEEIINKTFPALASWNDKKWDTWIPDPQINLPDFLRIGQTESGVPVGFPLFEEDALHSVFIIRGSEEHRQQAQDILANLVLRLALSLPKISRFSLVDPDHYRCFRMRKDLHDVRSTDDLSGALKSISQDITRISNDVLGYADSFDKLSSDIWASERFESVFVADFCSNKILKESQVLKSLLSLTHGAISGRFLFMYLNTDIELPDHVNNELFKHAVFIDLNDNQKVFFDTVPSGYQQSLWLNSVKQQKVAEKKIDFVSLVGANIEKGWQESSQDYIETTLGENISVWFGSKDGRNCPHGALAGTSGSGKSNFLHVLITGMALRYSPDELQFYLVDGKAGVGFQRYQRLPHAKVVSLQTSPLLALSVLREMVAEMDARYAMFSTAGVDNLSSYRTQTSKVVPRVLLIADEYQNLFEADSLEASNLIMKLAEKGRAAGVHLFLSSQSFIAADMHHTKKIFGNIAMRIALQLAEEPIEQFKQKGCKMIKELDRPGMVVINDNLGEDTSNTRGITSEIPDKESETLISNIIELASQSTFTNVEPAIVFKGADNPQLTDSQVLQYFIGLPAYLQQDDLSIVAKKSVRERGFGIESWHALEKPVAFMLGRNFEVYGDAILALRRAKYENALIISHNTECAKRLLATSLMTLASIYSKEQVELYILEAGPVEMPGGGLLEKVTADLLNPIGYKTHLSRSEDDINAVIHQLADMVDKRKSTNIESLPSIIVVLSEIEELSADDGAIAALNKILLEGSKHGLHVILQLPTIHQLSSLLNETNASRYLRVFNHRVLWNMSEEDSRNVIGNKKASELDNLALGEIAMYQNNAKRTTCYFSTYQLPSSMSPILDSLRNRA